MPNISFLVREVEFSAICAVYEINACLLYTQYNLSYRDMVNTGLKTTVDVWIYTAIIRVSSVITYLTYLITYLLTYLLTYSMEHSRSCKLTGFQLVKKFPIFYRT
jgi:hypothetical protein